VMIGRFVGLLHLGSFWCGGIVDNHLQKVWHLRMLLRVSHLCMPWTIADPSRYLASLQIFDRIPLNGINNSWPTEFSP
jgi:hypothetical protein